MNIRWIIVLIIFAAMTFSSFYFSIKAGCIRNKYLNWKDILLFRVRERYLNMNGGG
jgi:hypothetical protein